MLYPIKMYGEIFLCLKENSHLKVSNETQLSTLRKLQVDFKIIELVFKKPKKFDIIAYRVFLLKVYNFTLYKI